MRSATGRPRSKTRYKVLKAAHDREIGEPDHRSFARPQPQPAERDSHEQRERDPVLPRQIHADCSSLTGASAIGRWAKPANQPSAVRKPQATFTMPVRKKTSPNH